MNKTVILNVQLSQTADINLFEKTNKIYWKIEFCLFANLFLLKLKLILSYSVHMYYFSIYQFYSVVLKKIFNYSQNVNMSHILCKALVIFGQK